MNISIFMQNRPHFGTTLLHLPLLHSLKTNYPNANIYLFSKNESSKLLKEIIPIKELFINKNRFKEITDYRSIDSDITISLRKNSLFLVFTIFLFNRKKKYGFKNTLTPFLFTSSNSYINGEYRSENFLNLLPKDIEHHYFKIEKEKHITLIPAGEYQFKHWDITNYLQLATLLQRAFAHLEIHFVLGKSEEKYLKTIQNHSSSFYIDYALDMKKLFHIIQSSRLVIGNDCGPAHIAQISDVSNIILFSNENKNGKATVKEWFRKKEDSHYFLGEEAQSINTLTVESVYSKACSLLEN